MHGLPEGKDAAANGCFGRKIVCVDGRPQELGRVWVGALGGEECGFVGQDSLSDGEPALCACSEQFRRVREGIGDLAWGELFFERVRRELGCGEDKAAAD